jgi:AAA domain
MTPAARLTLRRLTITDHDLPPADITFSKGLNLIVGASDTGKTFVFEAIEYMLGAKGPLRRIPEAKGYTDVSVEIDSNTRPPVTFRRPFDGGEVVATEFGKGRNSAPTATKRLAVSHGKDPEASVSSYLLRAIGLQEREIRKNARGEKQGLSFRQLCRLSMVGEERIIQQASPVLQGQYVTKTADEGLFALLLTGLDDSDVVAVETKHEQAARLALQADVVRGILDEKRLEFLALKMDPRQLPAEVRRLDSAIVDATSTVVASQGEIRKYQERRDHQVAEQASQQSRLLFAEEQVARLQLLRQYYDTDHARLQTLVQASRTFHTMPEGSCPFCRRPYSGTTSHAGHEEFEAACSSEMRKIDVLRADLGLAITDLNNDSEEIRTHLSRIAEELAEIERRLEGILMPSVMRVEGDLQALVKSRTVLEQAVTLDSTIRGLEMRLTTIAFLREQGVARPSFDRRTTTSAASEFCETVEELLTAWRYPNLGRVSFDPEKVDLVIGGQDRANKGKGYRAITYAAFVIGLMKYCRSQGIPHPGLVVLDTPLNPFRGPTSESANERVADEVKVAFYEYLATDITDDQVIIMENEDPPTDVATRVTCHRFTKNRTIGRYGFFPV